MIWFWTVVSSLIFVWATHSYPTGPDGVGAMLGSSQIKQDDADNHVLVGSHFNSETESTLPTGDKGMLSIKPTELILNGLNPKGETLETSQVLDSRLLKNQNSGLLPQGGYKDTMSNKLISDVTQKLITTGPIQSQYFPQGSQDNLETEKKWSSNEQGQVLSQQGQFGQLEQSYPQQKQASHQMAAEVRLGEVQESQYGQKQSNQVRQSLQPQVGTGLSQQPQYSPNENQFAHVGVSQSSLGPQSQRGLGADQQEYIHGQQQGLDQSYDLAQKQQSGQGGLAPLNALQQNQYGENRLSMSSQGEQNQLGLGGERQLDLKQQSMPNKQPELGQYLDSRGKPLATTLPSFTDRGRLQLDNEDEHYYYEQTQEPLQDEAMVSSEKQAIEAAVNSDRMLPVRPTLLPEHYPTVEAKSGIEESLVTHFYGERDEEEEPEEDEEYKGGYREYNGKNEDEEDYRGKNEEYNGNDEDKYRDEDEEDKGKEEEEYEKEDNAGERAELNKEQDSQDFYGEQPDEGDLHANSQYHSDPTRSPGVTSDDWEHGEQDTGEQDRDEDDWYDDPNSYGEDDKSYGYDDQKDEETEAQGDQTVQLSGNDEYYKNQQEYQQGDGGFEEDVVDSDMVKKDKQPTAPSSMVLFYTWTIVAILIMVVSVSTYQTRCKGLRSRIPKLALSDDRKRLLEHEYP